MTPRDQRLSELMTAVAESDHIAETTLGYILIDLIAIVQDIETDVSGHRCPYCRGDHRRQVAMSSQCQ